MINSTLHPNQVLSGAVKALFSSRESETGVLLSWTIAVTAAHVVAVVLLVLFLQI